MELTTVQKIKVLNWAIKEIEEGYSDYMCSAILGGLIREWFPHADIHHACEIYPQLLKYKPWFKKKGNPWFRVKKRDKRIRILKEVKHRFLTGT